MVTLAFCSRKEQRCWLADQNRAANDDDIGAGEVGALGFREDHAADRRARAQPRLAEHKLAGARFGEAVDIFQRIERGEHGRLADVLRQRQLDENAVYVGIAESASTLAIRSAWLVSAGNLISTLRMPASTVALPLEAT
jgi:hypothetical protein